MATGRLIWVRAPAATEQVVVEREERVEGVAVEGGEQLAAKDSEDILLLEHSFETVP